MLTLSRRARVTITERDAMSQDTEEAIKKKEQEAEERRQQSHNLVADTIKRELLESMSNQPTPPTPLAQSAQFNRRGEGSRNS